MKKMFLALAVMMCALAVQAVTLNWTTEFDNSWAGSVTKGYLVYTASNEAVTDATLASVANAVYKNTLDSSVYTTVSTDATLQADYAGETSYFTNIDSKVVDTGTYILVFTDANGLYAASYVTAAETANAWTPVSGPMDGATYGPVTVAPFTGTLVPEPTALALLALGIAGLALRRRA